MNLDSTIVKNIYPDLDYIVIDIETTGLSYIKNEIIEIGAVRYSKGKVVEKFSKFIKPRNVVPLFIYKLTNIKESELKAADRCDIVFESFLKFINSNLSSNTFLVFHNAEFDVNFLNYHLVQCNFTKLEIPILDTLVLSRIFLPFLKSHNLSSVVEYFSLVFDNAHRAIFDAEATGEVFSKITYFIIDNIHAQQISFLTTLVEYICKNNGKKMSFLSKSKYESLNDGIDSLLLYLVLLRDYIIKHSLNKDYGDNPYKFSHFNYIENVSDNKLMPSVDDVFKTGGYFDRSFDKYEIRDGQIEMSNSVLDAYNNEKFLLIEAGTGVGKSLAYLIPSLKYSTEEKKKIVISTNTKNLQEQLLFKDLPLISKAIDINFSAVLIKGRDNYLCIRKWQEIFESFTLKQANIPFSGYEAYGLLFLYLWAENTKTGDIAENAYFSSSPYSFIWKKISSDRHMCLGRKCRFFKKCFLMDIRQRAENANLVIINHSLLFSDFQNDQSTLGEITHLVFDEAHNLLQSASSYLGFTLSYSDLQGFINTIFAIKNSYQTGMMVNIKNSSMKSKIPVKEKEALVKDIDDLIGFMEDNTECLGLPFMLVAEDVSLFGSYNKYRITNSTLEKKKNRFSFNKIQKSIEDIQDFLKELFKNLKKIHLSISIYDAKMFYDQDIVLDFLDKSSEKILQFLKQLESLLEPNFDKYAYWLSSFEISVENYPKGVFNYAPIQVDEILPDVLYSKVKSIVFTSATMSLRKNFKFVISSLGLDKYSDMYNNLPGNEGKTVKLIQKIVPSPFDYDKQALIINTSFLPPVTDSYFIPQSKELLNVVLDNNRVGSLILFTSYKDLTSMYEALEQPCYEKDILLLAQGISGSRNSILNQFINKGDAVLLGTNSFWEGVDVQGDSLSLLVMFKLPFQVPSEPIVEAYIEKLEKEGKNAFMYYTLPNSLLKMRQGIGRLIRSKTDRGVILILDNRITTKYYGKYFQEITPTKIHNSSNPVEAISAISKMLTELP
ncbi:MAG: helicase C-terminal domain-containing protein [Candidatus Cloacimonetes bacterium]|nr:helicase C-terminal domain-containing protein [Candidatus Cloacimonadota bacterium]